MIIDAHAHVGEGELLNDIFQVNNDPRRVEHLMTKAGVDRTVIFPVTYKDYAQPNMEVAKLAKENPRFIGFARIRADSPDAPAMLDFAVHELGLKGVKIHPSLEGFPTRETMRKLNELRVPVVFHSGMGLAPLTFEGIASSYPDLPIILAHIGTELDFRYMFSSTQQAIWMANHFDHVYLDTAAVYIQRCLEQAVAEVKADKIIFGTDSPWFHPAIELARIRDLEISDSDRDKILGVNIARLLDL